MIVIFCALKCEAIMLIKHYKLKRIETKAFSIYVSEDEKIMLVITGVGKIAAANAVGFIAGKFDIASDTSIINFGSAAGVMGLSIGELILANKITDQAAGRDFYPDMIISANLKEGKICSRDSIITVDDVIETKDDIALFDMEASAIYQSAISYIGPHQMHFLKIVSDNGVKQISDYKALSQHIEQIILEKENEITSFIDEVMAFTNEYLVERQELSVENKELLKNMSAALKCSVSMERELYQLFIYKELEGTALKPYFAEYELRGLLPCKSKKEGKVLLDEIRRNMLK